MSTAESHLAPPGTASAAVKVAGLTKRFGVRTALAGLTLSVGAGEIVGLLGANGGGKTTTLRILAGLLAPDGGCGTVLGYDLGRERTAIRGRVGYLAQGFSLYASLSVRENLRFRADVFALPDSRDAVAAVVNAFGLESVEKLTLQQLSAGRVRLVQLAAAVVHAPPLVLLDEPTAGMDAVVRESVWRQIARLAGRGTAVVLSTHDLADASRCGKIVWLNEGISRHCGAPSEAAHATVASVLLIRGADLIGLIEPLQALPGVIACYPKADRLRVIVAPGAASRICQLPLVKDCAVETVAPTLEDAVLEWSTQGAQEC